MIGPDVVFFSRYGVAAERPRYLTKVRPSWKLPNDDTVRIGDVVQYGSRDSGARVENSSCVSDKITTTTRDREIVKQFDLPVESDVYL